ncbi:MAG: thrombospondin type 3 repeat-containing protein, partial [Bacteroidota bacterium]
MKQSLIAFLILCCLTFVGIQTASAQISTAKNGITYKFIGTDYATPVLSNFLETSQINLGGEIGYNRYLNKSFNVNFPLRLGVIDYPLNDEGTAFQENELFASLDAVIQYKLNNGYILPEGAVIAPYLLAGIGGVYLDPSPDNFDVQVPLGAGINIKLAKGIYAQVQGEYRLALIEDFNNITYSGGLLFNFGNGEEEPKVEEPLDSDGDGIADAVDDCPQVAGTSALNGCPDRDGDGIADKDDRCPDQPGIADFDGCPDTDADGLADGDDECPDEPGPISNKGCPQPVDTDGDGIVDDSDDCPNTPGIAAFNGCPDSDGDGVKDSEDDCPNTVGIAAFNGCPDTDGDGLKDGDDKCPTKAGPISNKGCPELTAEAETELEFATKNVNFETGSNTLTKSSYI